MDKADKPVKRGKFEYRITGLFEQSKQWWDPVRASLILSSLWTQAVHSLTPVWSSSLPLCSWKALNTNYDKARAPRRWKGTEQGQVLGLGRGSWGNSLKDTQLCVLTCCFSSPWPTDSLVLSSGPHLPLSHILVFLSSWPSIELTVVITDSSDDCKSSVG